MFLKLFEDDSHTKYSNVGGFNLLNRDSSLIDCKPSEVVVSLMLRRIKFSHFLIKLCADIKSAVERIVQQFEILSERRSEQNHFTADSH